MDFRLRQATPEDADAVVLMQTLAHEGCYPHLLSPAFFERRRAGIPERVERRRAFLDTREPRILAFDADNQLVGYADAGPGREDDAPEALELYSIYTLRRTYGSGLGAALVRAAVGSGPTYLWVLENNPRALAFYLKQGFRPDGKRNTLPPEWEALPELRLVRRAKEATER
ncbi:GNAT superfamily N-acetyltransferase [Pseudarthrobacter defluvii]|uniref:GNAT superfamily N-acetyltransferase n=1 Tax=Pseudarthrobacter defluvii TaxID=410837 RepID=A0ABT9UEB5_9MICC|nr:GNAT family N-acetyltransferase [Pseudarthrobacter defluvii]MDQ0117981.1 GNAT superfamily N-acetyltransferase [Pseudarthrobacter defluvii]